MPVEVRLSDLVRMGIVSEDESLGSLKKVVNRLKREGIVTSYRQGSDLFMLTQKANRDCLFMDSKTRLCTTYDRRPDVCRQFPSVGPRPGFCPSISK